MIPLLCLSALGCQRQKETTIDQFSSYIAQYYRAQKPPSDILLKDHIFFEVQSDRILYTLFDGSKPADDTTYFYLPVPKELVGSDSFHLLTILLKDNRELLLITQSDGLYYTKNFGEKWEWFGEGLPSIKPTDEKQQPYRPSIVGYDYNPSSSQLYILFQDSLYLSADFGKSFNEVPLNGIPTPSEFLALATTHQEEPTIIISTARHGIFMQSIQRPMHFEPIAKNQPKIDKNLAYVSPVTCFTLLSKDPNELYFGESDRLYRMDLVSKDCTEIPHLQWIPFSTPASSALDEILQNSRDENQKPDFASIQTLHSWNSMVGILSKKHQYYTYSNPSMVGDWNWMNPIDRDWLLSVTQNKGTYTYLFFNEKTLSWIPDSVDANSPGSASPREPIDQEEDRMILGGYIPIETLVRSYQKYPTVAENHSFNALVITVKEGDGSVYAPLDDFPEIHNPFLKTVHKPIPLLKTILSTLKAKGYYTIARFITYWDEHASSINEYAYALKRSSQKRYTDEEGNHWIDPFSDEVNSYLLALLPAIEALGFDEIQLDFFRFPDSQDSFESLSTRQPNHVERWQPLKSFLKQAHNLVKIPISVAIKFENAILPVSLSTGQYLKELVPYMDILSPMFYPCEMIAKSMKSPDLETVKDVITFSCKRLAAMIPEKKIRPYLQSFSCPKIPYTKRLAKEIIQTMDRLQHEIPLNGFLYWNIHGKYTIEKEILDSYTF